MKFIGGFFQFAQRVLDAAKKGGLAEQDQKKLDNLLARTGKRNTILAKGILTSLSAGGASDADIARFSDILQSAEQKMSQEKEPFSKAEKDEIQDIFKRAYISSKTARWFSAQVDELLASDINEYISGSRRVDIGVPSKKSVRFEQDIEKKPDEEKKKKIRA